MGYVQTVPLNLNNPGDTFGVGHLGIINNFITNYGAQVMAIADAAARETFIIQNISQVAAQLYNINEDVPAALAKIPGYNGSLSAIDFEGQYATIIAGIPGIAASTVQQLTALLNVLTACQLTDDCNVAYALNTILAVEVTFLRNPLQDPKLLAAISGLKFSIYARWINQNAASTVPVSPLTWNYAFANAICFLTGSVATATAASTAIWYSSAN